MTVVFREDVGGRDLRHRPTKVWMDEPLLAGEGGDAQPGATLGINQVSPSLG